MLFAVNMPPENKYKLCLCVQSITNIFLLPSAFYMTTKCRTLLRSLSLLTQNVVKQMIQEIAAYQYEIDCFQSITYKYFLNTSRTNNHYSNIGKPTQKVI